MLLHATVSPSHITFSSLGHTAFKFVKQPVSEQFPPLGVSLTGRLKPPKRLMSNKLSPPVPLKSNSTKVIGGAGFPPAHSTVEVPQSPVTHENLSVMSREQRVRPHNRPDQAGGTGRVLESPGMRAKPVVESSELSLADKIAGHTV